MAINNACKCDVCQATEVADRARQMALPDGWGTLFVSMIAEDEAVGEVHYDICPQCLEKINTALASAGLTADKGQPRIKGSGGAMMQMLGLG